MKVRQACVGLALVCALGIFTAQADSARKAKSLDPKKAVIQQWTAELGKRSFYLREPELPLLANDRLRLTRCKIRYSPTLEGKEAYTASLQLEGMAPAPTERLKLLERGFASFPELEGHLSGRFSPFPLEDAYDWSDSVKGKVRNRYIDLGMEPEMVKLILGGLGYQVDLEKLDDGRTREVWKLQVKGDTRKVFTARSATVRTTTNLSAEAYASRNYAQVTATADSKRVISETGFYLFSGLPPQFLNIIFTDGKVTARKTEFLK